MDNPELFMGFFREFTDPKSYKIFSAENIKGSELYGSFSKNTAGFTRRNFELGINVRFNQLDIEVKLLNECRQIFINEKYPTYATHYLSAAKGCMKLIGECTARLFEASHLHHAIALNWKVLWETKLELLNSDGLINFTKSCDFLFRHIRLIACLSADNDYFFLHTNLKNLLQALSD